MGRLWPEKAKRASVALPSAAGLNVNLSHRLIVDLWEDDHDLVSL